MLKGIVPMARQRGKLNILVHQIPALVCPSCESFVLDESIEARVVEIIDETHRTSAKSAEVELYRYAEKEHREEDYPAVVGAAPWAAIVFPSSASRPKGPLLQSYTPQITRVVY